MCEKDYWENFFWGEKFDAFEQRIGVFLRDKKLMFWKTKTKKLRSVERKFYSFLQSDITDQLSKLNS